MKRLKNGFTLIELMIVVGIIAILAAIAIPAYQNYLISAQVSEGVLLADGAKVAVSEYYSDHGTFPSTNASAGLATNTLISGKYTDNVNVAGGDGTIVAVFGKEANQKIVGLEFVLAATPNDGTMSWDCKTKTTVPQSYLPSSCRK